MAKVRTTTKVSISLIETQSHRHVKKEIFISDTDMSNLTSSLCALLSFWPVTTHHGVSRHSVKVWPRCLLPQVGRRVGCQVEMRSHTVCSPATGLWLCPRALAEEVTHTHTHTYTGTGRNWQPSGMLSFSAGEAEAWQNEAAIRPYVDANEEFVAKLDGHPSRHTRRTRW